MTIASGVRGDRMGRKCCGTSGGSTGLVWAYTGGAGEMVVPRLPPSASSSGRCSAGQGLDLLPCQWSPEIRHRPTRLEDHRRVLVNVMHQEDAGLQTGQQPVQRRTVEPALPGGRAL